MIFVYFQRSNPRQSGKRNKVKCLVTAIATASDVALGCYAIKVLSLLYRAMFIPSITFNSETWTCITNEEYRSLEVIQLKFLKRIMHAPSSTSNAATLLEFGVLPVKCVIHVRKLCFLHHILSRGMEDPVRITYCELGRYECAENWHNEVKELRKEYALEESDEEIQEMSKESWKERVKNRVAEVAVCHLNKVRQNQSRTSGLPANTSLHQQKYFGYLSSTDTRIMFKARTGTLDTKTFKRYKYEDEICRLCGEEPEDLQHIVNKCTEVKKSETKEINIYTIEEEEVKEMLRRLKDFIVKVDENDKELSSNMCQHVTED